MSTAEEAEPPAPREPHRWLPGKKAQAMEIWSGRVMADHELAKAEIRVAWALTYGFNSEDGRCWETKATIAKRCGLSVSGVKSALTALDRRGHISRASEVIRGDSVRVIRPTLTRAFGMPEPRPRRGGISKRVDQDALFPEPGGLTFRPPGGTDLQAPQRTDVQAPGGTDLQAPCILEESGINPGVDIAGVVTRESSPEATQFEDDWDDDDSFPEPGMPERRVGLLQP